MEKSNDKKIISPITAAILAAAIILYIFLNALTAHASEATGHYTYNFTITDHGGSRYMMKLSSDYPCVATATYGQGGYKGFNYGSISTSNGYQINFYTLDSTGNSVGITPYCVSEQTYINGVWTEKYSYEYGTKTLNATYLRTSNSYIDLKGSGLKCLHFTMQEVTYDEENDKNISTTVGADNIASYLATGTFAELPRNTSVYALEELASLAPAKYQYSASTNYRWITYNEGISLSDVSIDENGKITWRPPTILQSCVYKGVVVSWCNSSTYRPMTAYYKTFPMSNSIKISIPSGMDITNIQLYPYAITTDGKFIGAKSVSIVSLDATASYMNVENPTVLVAASELNNTGGGIEVGTEDDFNNGNSNGASSDFNGITSVIGSDIASSTDEYISENGTHQEDIPTPRLVFTGNGYNFYISNSNERYNIEIQGRWYSVDDVEIYREGAMWKYRYSTLLKNGLSTWLKYTDRVTSVGTHDLCRYGAVSFADLLDIYPINRRNFYGSSNAVTDYFNGYSDSLTMLKEGLLPSPESLYNGCEVYVRFYTTDENGLIKYGKWCHWYDALASESGSSGSRWDDVDNMFQESQSSSGLSDSQKDEVENSGDSKNNDNDVQTSINTGSSSWETESAETLWTTVQSLADMLGDFPSLFAQVFSFMPSWVIALIAVGIGALVILRFLGR
uniref:hypothetical protein n=1 Tax=Acetatifactor sp. TaxID=1872090 RepID=UPI0040560DD7